MIRRTKLVYQVFRAFSKFSKSLTFIILISTLVSVCISTAYTAAASNNRGLIVSPITNDLDVDKGQVYEYNLNMENDTDSYKYNIEISKQSFAPSEVDGVPELIDFSKTNDYSSWLTFEKDSFSIEPTKEQDIKVRLNIPQDAKSGGYYFAIILTDNPNLSDDSVSGVKITQRIVSLLFVNVKGKVDRIIKFQNLSSNLSLYDPFFDSILLKYQLRLEGGSYTKPSGNIFLNKGSESGVTVFPLNPEEKIILPGSNRSLQISSPASVNVPFLSNTAGEPVQNNDAKTSNTVFKDWQKPLIGVQNVEARVVYVNQAGKSEQSSNLNLYFFPWKTLLLVLIPAAVFYMIYRFLKKR